MKKKLLFVVNSSKFFLSHRLSLAQAALAAGYEVHVATPVSRLNQRIIDAQLIYHPIKLDRGGKNPFKEAITIFSLWRLYRRIQPDIIHQVTVKPILYGGIAARFANIPATVNAFTGLGFMFTNHSVMTRFLRYLMQCGYKFAFRHKNTRVIFQNEDDKNQLVNSNLLTSAQCTLIRGSGVSMSDFIPSDEVASDVLVVLAARMLWDKGIAEFVEAARYLKSKKIAARFALVGGLDEANPSAVREKQLQSWVSDGVVEWWGERSDMPAVMQRAHIICLPSYREGMPRVLVEAAASSRPIVATDVPGCRDVVQHQFNGLLVPAKNSMALATAIEALITDPTLRRFMGQKGRELVEREYALENIIQQTLTIYDSLMVSTS